MSPLEGQILEELSHVLDSLATVLGAEVVVPLRARAEGQASAIAKSLTGEQDSAEGMAVAMMGVLYPGGATPPPSWWRSPLGRVCAPHALDRLPDRLTAPAAAAILGVGPSRIYQLRSTGKLEAHPAGGVSWSSVAQRLATHPHL